MATTDIYTIQGSLFPVRNALRFLGGNVDDGVQVDALAAAIVAANHTKGTISAWIMIPDYVPSTQLAIFGAGDANAAEYMFFCVTTARKLQFKVYDGGATRVDVSTTNAVITPHKWYHVALVQDAIYPKIYVNGVLQDLTFATSTEVTQWFDDTDGIDGAHIGAADSIAGDAALTLEFKGYISDFKIWSGTTDAKALSQAEIIKDMNGSTTSETPLANYNMDSNVVDLATGGATYDGTIVGDLIYVQANEFSSRLTFGSGVPVTADNVSISATNDTGFGLVIQQA
jgi:hypothetical protein